MTAIKLMRRTEEALEQQIAELRARRLNLLQIKYDADLEISKLNLALAILEQERERLSASPPTTSVCKPSEPSTPSSESSTG